MLEAFKVNVIDWAEWSRAWSASRKTEADLPIEMTLGAHQQVDSYKMHGEYFGSRIRHDYNWLSHHHILVDSDTLRQKWDIPEIEANFLDGRYNVPTELSEVWLFAIVHAALVRNFRQSTAPLALVWNTFASAHKYDTGSSGESLDRQRERARSSLGHRLQYLTTFAELRGILTAPCCATSSTENDSTQPEEHKKVDFDAMSKEDLAEVHELMRWLLGEQCYGWHHPSLRLWANGTSVRLVGDLITLGLQLKIKPGTTDTADDFWDGIESLECVNVCYNPPERASTLQQPVVTHKTPLDLQVWKAAQSQKNITTKARDIHITILFKLRDWYILNRIPPPCPTDLWVAA